MPKKELDQGVVCSLCDFKSHSLLEHLPEVHGISVQSYLQKFPESPSISQTFLSLLQEFRKGAPPLQKPKSLFHVGNVSFPTFPGVPLEKCLPLPEHYKFPSSGQLRKDIEHASISLTSGRSIYISGVSGSGKDAFIHALSYHTRRPAEVFQITPGNDISHWFFSRAFNLEGTFWEEGRLLTCLRDGYTTTNGETIPYLILISDLDRADKTQVETLRLILDSIQGRVKGPQGITYPVLAGTQIIATANTTGGGDTRGQYLSANPLDSSIIARFHAGFEFHWMAWSDEEVVLKNKFPLLNSLYPLMFTTMKDVTKKIREAIDSEKLYCDFSHRDLCSWLQHTEDRLRVLKETPMKALRNSRRAWVDRLPDPETKLTAERIIDAHLEGGAL